MVFGTGTGAHKGTQKKIPVDIVQGFWPGLGLPVIMPKFNSCQTIYGKEQVKVRSTALSLRYKKDPYP